MSKVVDVVVDVGSVVDNQKKAVGERLKQARAACGMTQKAFCAVIGKPVPSLQDYEAGKTMPGGDAVASMVRSGINANWLLTGEGPMLLADLQASAAAHPAIDSETLAYVIEEVENALRKRRAELPPARKAALIQLVYDYCADLGKKDPGMVERFLKLVA